MPKKNHAEKKVSHHQRKKMKAERRARRMSHKPSVQPRAAQEPPRREPVVRVEMEEDAPRITVLPPPSPTAQRISERPLALKSDAPMELAERTPQTASFMNGAILAATAFLGIVAFLGSADVPDVHGVLPPLPPIPTTPLVDEVGFRLTVELEEETPTVDTPEEAVAPDNETHLTRAAIPDAVENGTEALKRLTSGAAVQAAGMDLVAGRVPPMETASDIAAVRLAMAIFRPDKRPDFSSESVLRDRVAALTTP